MLDNEIPKISGITASFTTCTYLKCSFILTTPFKQKQKPWSLFEDVLLPVLPYSQTKSTDVSKYLETYFLPSKWNSPLLVWTLMYDTKVRSILTCLLAGWLWGKDPGASTGELAGLQSSGNGFGMAGKDDVLNCCSSSCRRLQTQKHQALRKANWHHQTYIF